MAACSTGARALVVAASTRSETGKSLDGKIEDKAVCGSRMGMRAQNGHGVVVLPAQWPPPWGDCPY